MAHDTIRPTRYPRLGYRCDGRALWRVYDRETDSAVGPHYASKAELLGDLARFAGVFGVEPNSVPFVDVQHEHHGDGVTVTLSRVIRVF